jgi:hypothetical protein
MCESSWDLRPPIFFISSQGRTSWGHQQGCTQQPVNNLKSSKY